MRFGVIVKDKETTEMHMCQSNMAEVYCDGNYVLMQKLFDAFVLWVKESSYPSDYVVIYSEDYDFSDIFEKAIEIEQDEEETHQNVISKMYNEDDWYIVAKVGFDSNDKDRQHVHDFIQTVVTGDL